MSSIDIQAAIKNNSQDLIEYMSELKKWEKEIKAEDFKLKSKKSNDVSCSLKIPGSSESKKIMLNNDISAQQKAQRLKEEGNKYYSEGNFKQAAEKYEEGIKLDPCNAVLFANRAMVHLKLENYECAISDCEKCLKIDDKYIKAYLRRATAFSKLFQYSSAMDDFNKVLEIEPWNKEANKELEKLKKELVKCASTDNCEVTNSSLDIVSGKIDAHDCIDVDTSYSPILELKTPYKGAVTSSTRAAKGKFANKKDVSPVRFSKYSKLQEAPPPPRTSHQFYLDWKKVVNDDSLAEAYLLSIPGSFFHGVEVDVDQLVEIIHHLNSSSLEPSNIVELLQSLMCSRGFYLNLAFLEPEQKKEFEDLIKKMEDKGINNENIRKIKQSLSIK